MIALRCKVRTRRREEKQNARSTDLRLSAESATGSNNRMPATTTGSMVDKHYFCRHKKEAKSRQIPTKRKAAVAELDESIATASQPASTITRGVSRRSTGMWHSQVYFSGQTRYIGVFEKEKNAALAYKIARAKLQISKGNSSITPEDAFNNARRSALDGVKNEKNRPKVN